MFRKTLIAVALGLPVVAFAEPNLLNDGTFANLSGPNWVVNSGGGTYAPVVITYGSTAPYPSSAFGEAVPPDTIPTNPANTTGDPVGTTALYFVDDSATQTVTSNSFVTGAGQYVVGFDWYIPANGFANAGNFTLTAKIDNIIVSSFTSSSGSTPQQWTPVSGTFTPGAGSHTFVLTYSTSGGFSKDVNVDRAFVTAVPEPGTTGMMLAGLAIFGMIAVRRSARG